MNGCDSPAISAEKGNPVRSKAECGEEVIMIPRWNLGEKMLE
jgi:hypothetical protein